MSNNDEISDKLIAVANQIEKIGTDTAASVTKLETRIAAMEEDKKKDKEAMMHAKKGDDKDKDDKDKKDKDANDDDDEKKKKMKEMEEKNASLTERVKRVEAMASAPRIRLLKQAYKDAGVDDKTMKTKIANWEKMPMEELDAAYETVQPFIRSTPTPAPDQWQMPPTGYGQDNTDLITLEASDDDILAIANAEAIR